MSNRKLLVPPKLFKRLGNQPNTYTESPTSPNGGGRPALSRGMTKKFTSSVMVTLPHVIRESIDYLWDTGGDSTEDLFRVSADPQEIESILKRFDRVQVEGLTSGAEIYEELKPDPHVVAGVIKRYLLTRGMPLIPDEQQEAAVERVRSGLAANKDLQFIAYEVVVEALNVEKRDRECLAYILRFLEKLSRKEDENKMSIEALATVFGPIIMRKEADPIPKEITNVEEPTRSMQEIVIVTQILITNVAELLH